MTREESTNRIFELNEHYGINLGEIEVGVVAVEALVNEIYDDFESRTCENCKFYIEERISLYHNGTQYICRNEQVGDIVYDYLGFDFGCNKFERKTDE